MLGLASMVDGVATPPHIVDDVLVLDVLYEDRRLLRKQHGVIPANAERMANFGPLLFLDAPNDHLESPLDIIHPLLVLSDSVFLRETDLLTDVGLLVQFILLAVKFLF